MEQRDVLAIDELKPDGMRYPRDSLDPQLVWKGKDEQDAVDLGGPDGADLSTGVRSATRATSLDAGEHSDQVWCPTKIDMDGAACEAGEILARNGACCAME